MKLCSKCNGVFDSALVVCPRDGALASFIREGDRLLGRYEYIDSIGRGGVATVIKARHQVLNKVVAIKILNAKEFSREQLKRFELEAKIISRMKHPNIISVKEFGTSELGYPYMVIDFIDGYSLQQALRRHGYFSITAAIAIVLQTCAAVQHAHDIGVVHRDLKPSNIMLKERGPEDYNVVVLDFGIAKVIEAPVNYDRQLTQTGEIFGSPTYMSPEQILAQKVDFRSDIYSIGCIFYECLTGIPPLCGETVIDTLGKQINELPASLQEASLGRVFPAALEQVVFKCLAKDPNERFSSPQELSEALNACLNGRIMPEKTSPDCLPSSEDRTPPVWSRRSRSALLAGLISAILLCIAARLLLSIKPKVEQHRFLVPYLIPSLSPQEWQSKHSDSAPPITRSAALDSNASSELSMLEDFSKIPPDKVVKTVINYGLGHEGTVSLSNVAFTKSYLQALEKSAKLKILVLKSCKATNWLFDYLAGLPVEKIALKDVDLDDSGLARIRSLNRLSYFQLTGCNRHKPLSHRVTTKGLEYLKRLPHLRSLELTNDQLSDLDLAFVEHLPILSYLDLSDNSQISDCALNHIQMVKQLKELHLGHTRISLAALSKMKNVSELRTISLVGNQSITNEGMDDFVRQAVSVESLHLDHSDISEQALLSLVQLPKLNELSIKGCHRLSALAVQRLVKALPQCIVDADY